MRAMLTGIMLLALTGCGLDETVFIPDYADAYCAQAMSCADAATLAFDGMSTLDDCLAQVGPDIEAEVAVCKYRGGKAKKCITAIENMSCPPDGVAFDQFLPVECESVLIDCEDGGATAEPTTTTTTTTTAEVTGE